MITQEYCCPSMFPNTCEIAKIFVDNLGHRGFWEKSNSKDPLLISLSDKYFHCVQLKIVKNKTCHLLKEELLLRRLLFSTLDEKHGNLTHTVILLASYWNKKQFCSKMDKPTIIEKPLQVMWINTCKLLWYKLYS